MSTRGRRRGKHSDQIERQVSHDKTEEPKIKESRLSGHQSNLLKKFTSTESEGVCYDPLFSLAESCSSAHPDCITMDTASDPPSRPDVCDSPTMPLLSPEVPPFGDMSSIVKDGPPVLAQYGVDDDACDQASDKSEGDSGKENDEDAGVKWKGSKSSLTSRASRSSRPRYGPFNQLNSSCVKVNSKPEKKTVLGETNSKGMVTRSSRLSKPVSISTLEIPAQMQSSKFGSNNDIFTAAVTTSSASTSANQATSSQSGSLASVENLDAGKKSIESPPKMLSLSTPQSPMSPHKIQIPDRQFPLPNKLKQAISTPPKKFSTKNAKRSNLRKTDEAKPAKKLGKLAQAAEGTRQITDFFPTRRSERKKKSEIEKDKMEGIEARLLATNDNDLDLEIKEIHLKGRGIVTKKSFSKGDFVLEYSGELIDIGSAKDRESMYSLDTTKGCYMYYFNHREKQYCIDATQETGRYGRLVNHSCKIPNCVTKVVMLGNEPRLILVAKQDIEEGTELLYDYGDRSKESLKAHPWLNL